MVEAQFSPFDSDGIPLVIATVAIDAEYDFDSIITAHAVPSPTPSEEDEQGTFSVSPSSGSTRSSERSQQPDCPLERQPPFRQQTDQDPQDERTASAAGIAGGVLGLLLGGPLLAFLFGFGAAFATKKDGAAGDVARALGEVALIAKERAREVDEKHHLVDKSKVVAAKCLEKLKEADQEHHFLEKMRTLVVRSLKSTIDFCRRNHLLERGIQAIDDGLERALERLERDRQRNRPSSPRGNETWRN